MNSKLFGKVEFDTEQLDKEISKILQFDYPSGYSDFSIGVWKACVLWNETGSKHDATFRSYSGRPKHTELGAQLDYLNSIISETFNLDHLKWVRIFYVRKGLIIPHRDFLELEKKFTRIHIPLQTDQHTCLHSEEEDVYHMRQGEIWFLDATCAHSACSLGDIERLSLCLDFESGIPIEGLLKTKSYYRTDINPCFISREGIDENFMQSIYGLSQIINETNFEDILSLLAKIHFVKQTNVASMYQWLIEIARRSNNNALLEKVTAMRRFYLEKRALGEVFRR